MSVFCQIVVALGIPLSFCLPPEDSPPRLSLPSDEEAAWEIPDAPAPPDVPEMPPIVIEKFIEVEKPVIVEVPAPSPPGKDEGVEGKTGEKQEPAEEKKAEPDPLERSLRAAWRRKPALPPGWDAPIPSGSPRLEAGEPLSPLPDESPLTQDALAPPPGYEAKRRLSGLPVDNTRILAADRVITGILEGGINSQVGGGGASSLVIQTARDVFGYHGRLILIPKGSRLLCDYMPPQDLGATRLEIICRRILMAEHRAEILQISAESGDGSGRAGVTGGVDRRFLERYGTAFLLAGISTGVRFGTAAAAENLAEDDPNRVAAGKAGEELSTRFGEITAQALEESLSLLPVITVPQGARVQIRPAADWYIAERGGE